MTDRLHTPGDDAALIWRTATKLVLLGNFDELVHPRFRRQGQRDVLLTVKPPSLVVRKNEPGPSVLVPFEGVITVDDVASLENRCSFVVGHCSFSTLGFGSLGACSRQAFFLLLAELFVEQGSRSLVATVSFESLGVVGYCPVCRLVFNEAAILQSRE